MQAILMRGLTNWYARVQQMRALRGIHSARELHSIIERERARVDRNSHEFALIVFEFAPEATDDRSLSRLAFVLARRVRSTDEVGWFDGHRIGVVLPYTSAAGAWNLADEICGKAVEIGKVARPKCTVYTYPNADVNGRNGMSSHNRMPEVWPETRSITARNRRRFETPPGYVAFAAASDSVDHAPARPVSELQRLLVHPLPGWKRVVDVVGAAIALVAFSPLMLVVALLIKLTSPGAVIFKQKRAKECGEPFTFYKFRTMYADAEKRKQELLSQNEQTGPVFKMRNDPRVTPIGRLLRETSIDELPQLWNVLKGDMTLVGPRPPTLDEVPQYEHWQRRRLSITPGITCIWQVSGRNEIGFEDWMRLDIRYAEARSPLLDLAILSRTVVAVLSRRGAC
ncbi:MAG: sugar transferase [Planctomycetes bacterium]|nr:sugar transferase [Planctomycetota bacterium]MBI3843471.1 sugar transferase [Planctomycetota bacterium]